MRASFVGDFTIELSCRNYEEENRWSSERRVRNCSDYLLETVEVDKYFKELK